MLACSQCHESNDSVSVETCTTCHRTAVLCDGCFSTEWMADDQHTVCIDCWPGHKLDCTFVPLTALIAPAVLALTLTPQDIVTLTNDIHTFTDYLEETTPQTLDDYLNLITFLLATTDAHQALTSSFLKNRDDLEMEELQKTLARSSALLSPEHVTLFRHAQETIAIATALASRP